MKRPLSLFLTLALLLQTLPVLAFYPGHYEEPEPTIADWIMVFFVGATSHARIPHTAIKTVKANYILGDTLMTVTANSMATAGTFKASLASKNGKLKASLNLNFAAGGKGTGTLTGSATLPNATKVKLALNTTGSWQFTVPYQGKFSLKGKNGTGQANFTGTFDFKSGTGLKLVLKVASTKTVANSIKTLSYTFNGTKQM
jgi:hypothetical protein